MDRKRLQLKIVRSYMALCLPLSRSQWPHSINRHSVDSRDATATGMTYYVLVFQLLASSFAFANALLNSILRADDYKQIVGKIGH